MKFMKVVSGCLTYHPRQLHEIQKTKPTLIIYIVIMENELMFFCFLNVITISDLINDVYESDLRLFDLSSQTYP